MNWFPSASSVPWSMSQIPPVLPSMFLRAESCLFLTGCSLRRSTRMVSGTISAIVSARFYRASTFRSWPMASPARESPTPWELRAPVNKVTRKRWVRSAPREARDVRCIRLTKIGIIPRAAQLLFEKLEGPTKPNRNSGTGLRTPSRYSVGSASSFGKASVEKNWQLKATYVEVCDLTSDTASRLEDTNGCRSTTNNCEISLCPNQHIRASGAQSPSARTQKDVLYSPVFIR